MIKDQACDTMDMVLLVLNKLNFQNMYWQLSREEGTRARL